MFRSWVQVRVGMLLEESASVDAVISKPGCGLHAGYATYTLFKPFGAKPPALARLGSQLPYSEINAQITRDALVVAAVVAALVALGAAKLVGAL